MQNNTQSTSGGSSPALFTCVLPKGCGYWDCTRFPIGGEFRRAVEDMPLVDCEKLNFDRSPAVGVPARLVRGKFGARVICAAQDSFTDVCPVCLCRKNRGDSCPGGCVPENPEDEGAAELARREEETERQNPVD